MVVFPCASKAQIIEETDHRKKGDLVQAMRGTRQPGLGGWRSGGRRGVGSPLGKGASRLNGLMMIGGIVGGADGGPLGPLSNTAQCRTWSPDVSMN